MISIVIPLYNKEKAIAGTLDSILAQTYTDYEVIVVNDGSTDNSSYVVEQWLNSSIHQSINSSFKLIHQPNGGVCSARNRGIQEAQGEYIAFLDADDLWDKDYLTEQVKMIQDFPNAAMWGINYGETIDGKIIRDVPTGLSKGYRGYVENYFYIQGRVSDLYCSSSVVIRKNVFKEVGYFDERIKYAEDTDMWWRIIAKHRVAFYDRYMVYYQFDAENRALKREICLVDSLPYYVDKYQQLIFKNNYAFYSWVNRWAAIRIKHVYFKDKKQRSDARFASTKLDYSVLPYKYRILFNSPFVFAYCLYKIDEMRLKMIQ